MYPTKSGPHVWTVRKEFAQLAAYSAIAKDAFSFGNQMTASFKRDCKTEPFALPALLFDCIANNRVTARQRQEYPVFELIRYAPGYESRLPFERGFAAVFERNEEAIVLYFCDYHVKLLKLDDVASLYFFGCELFMKWQSQFFD